jgi:hypothetical protein
MAAIGPQPAWAHGKVGRFVLRDATPGRVLAIAIGPSWGGLGPEAGPGRI